MTRRNASFAGLLGCVLLLLATQGTVRPAAAATRVTLAVVVGPGSKLTNMSLAELRRTFTGGGVNDDAGQRLVPFNYFPHSEERVAFDQVVLGLSPDEVSRFWIDRKIRGQSGPPRSLASPALLLRLVQRLPGAIAYTPAGVFPKGIRVVRVNGKLPGDAGYPLAWP